MKKFILVILLLFAARANASTISTNIPAPGAWSADLAPSTTGFASGDILRPPATGSILEFKDKAVWNPINNTAMILGGSHPNITPPNPYGQKFVKYTDSTNTWAELIRPSCGLYGPDPQCTVPPFPYDTGPAHDYHHSTINPTTGDFYHRQYGLSDAGSRQVMKFSQATQSWSQCTPMTGGTNVAEILQYFPERNSLIYIDGDWGVTELSLASGNCTSGTWTSLTGAAAGISSYHIQGAYSSLCACILYVGQDTTAMWRLNSNGTKTQVANAPQQPGIPQNPGTPQGVIFTTDPVSQHILMWWTGNAATTMYDYNPTTNTWATISRGSPMFPGPEGGVTETVAIPIASYGVIMFVSSGSSSGGQIRLYRHSAGALDTTAPTAPSGLTVTPVSTSQINLAWTASTDNVGVTAYLVERCAGASCVNFVQVYSVGTNSQNDTSLAANTLYRYRVRATDAAGNLSVYSSIAQATTLASGGGQTFAQRCAAAGVVLCNGFDVDADRGTVGASSIGTWRGVFRNGQSGCNTSDANRCPTIDTTTSASGGGSLKFVVPSNSDSGGSGQFFTNVSSDMSTRFGSGQTFYMQVRMRFSCDFLFTNCPAGTGVRAYAGSGGWKTVDISQADRSATCFPGSVTCATSCSELEIVVQNTNNSGFVQGYHGCPGTYQGSSFVFEQQAGSEFYRQNAYAGLCPRSEVIVGNLANCFTYKMNEWMTFKARVSIGTFVAGGTGACATFSQGCYPNSIVEYWMGREGQPLVKTHSFTFTLNASFDGTQTEKWGKFWLLPYNTGKDSTVSNPDAYLWYDELVISTQDIADPGVSSDPIPPTVAITSPIPPTSSSTTSPISVSGTAADNVSVTAVTWTCLACVTKGGTATSSPGTSISWLIQALDLGAGTNTLNVVSHDAAGNVSTAATLAITYTPGATYWVRPTGTMSGCTPSTTPPATDAGYKSTIDAGLGCLAAGNTLNIRAGTYSGSIRQTGWPSGSAGAYTTVQAYSGETAIIPGFAMYGDANTHHILLKGITIDGTGLSPDNGGFNLWLAHDITLDGLVVHHVNNSNQLSETQNIIIRNSTFRDGVSVCTPGPTYGDRWYGLYVGKSSGLVVENNTFYNLPGGGVHAYSADITPFNTNMTIRNNIMHDMPTCGTSNIGGFLISDTSSGQAYNNVIYNTLVTDAGPKAPGMYLFSNASNFNLYGNTVYSAGYGILIESAVSGTINIKNNILSTNTLAPYFNSSSATIVADHNLCSTACGVGTANQTELATATFIAPGTNFNLKAGSLALNNGTPLASPYNTDIINISRPFGAGFDIGAYESISPVTPPVVTIVNPTSNPTLGVSSPLFSLGGTSNLP